MPSTLTDPRIARRDASLRLANRRRLGLAAVCRQLRDGEIAFGEVMASPPTCLLNIPAARVVAYVPRMGDVRLARLNARALGAAWPVNIMRPIGQLTLRQRLMLVELVSELRQQDIGRLGED